MKKILLAIGLASLAISSTFAQSSVFAINGSGLLISTNSGTVSGLTQGNGYCYALLVDAAAPTSADPTSAGWQFSGVTMTNLVNGVISGGASVVANNWANNTFVNYEIVGWSTDGGLYSTWAQVSALLQNGVTGLGLASGTYYGLSAEGNAEGGGGNPSLAVWHLFGLNASGQGTPVPGFTLTPVPVPTPEPGTLALAALGGASMLLFRRKK